MSNPVEETAPELSPAEELAAVQATLAVYPVHLAHNASERWHYAQYLIRQARQERMAKRQFNKKFKIVS